MRVHAGCRCLKEWNYTSTKGGTFHITTGCSNPDGDQPVPWCMVDPTTCVHQPFVASTGSWDYCYNVGDTITIDTGASPIPLPGSSLPNSSSTGYVMRMLGANASRLHSALDRRGGSAGVAAHNVQTQALAASRVQNCSIQPASSTATHWGFVRAEKTANMCSCQPSWSDLSAANHLNALGGGCADDNITDNIPPWCYVIPETCGAPPQRRRGRAWDVCQGGDFVEVLIWTSARRCLQ